MGVYRDLPKKEGRTSWSKFDRAEKGEKRATMIKIAITMEPEEQITICNDVLVARIPGYVLQRLEQNR